MNESRKQFEEWVVGNYGYAGVTRKVDDGNHYVLSEIENMWESWRASRQELEGVNHE